jgi:hypothetical protein
MAQSTDCRYASRENFCTPHVFVMRAVALYDWRKGIDFRVFGEGFKNIIEIRKT